MNQHTPVKNISKHVVAVNYIYSTREFSWLNWAKKERENEKRGLSN